MVLVFLLLGFVLIILVRKCSADMDGYQPIGCLLCISFIVTETSAYQISYFQTYHTRILKLFFSFVPPIDFVHKIACGAPQSLEFPYGDLLFFLFCFVLGLHKVPNISPHITHVSHTYHARITHVSRASRTCHARHARVTHVSRTCHARVTHVSRTCHARVTHVSRTCHARVTHVSRTCHARVTHVSRTCHARVTHVSHTYHRVQLIH